MIKENLEKNHGSGEYQLKSLGLFVPFHALFQETKDHIFVDNINAS